MAQATLDPAVMDAPAGAETSKTDDLLNKMIGEEVDALLAEAEAARAQAAAAAPPVPVSLPVEPAVAATASPPGEVLPSDVAGLDSAKIAAEDNALASQLDDLIQGLDGTPPAPAAPPSPPEVPVPKTAQPPAAPAPAEAAPVPPADAEAERLKTLAGELELDKAPAPEPAPAPAAADAPVTAEAPAAPAEMVVAKPDPAAVPAEYRIPWLLRPLIWINSPLDGCSEKTRALIGKAAILTVVNSVGLLVYVAVFRKHH